MKKLMILIFLSCTALSCAWGQKAEQKTQVKPLERKPLDASIVPPNVKNSFNREHLGVHVLHWYPNPYYSNLKSLTDFFGRLFSLKFCDQ